VAGRCDLLASCGALFWWFHQKNQKKFVPRRARHHDPGLKYMRPRLDDRTERRKFSWTELATAYPIDAHTPGRHMSHEAY